jgi:hypothetical protein
MLEKKLILKHIVPKWELFNNFSIDGHDYG